MNRIKSLLLAASAVFAIVFTFSACSDDSSGGSSSDILGVCHIPDYPVNYVDLCMELPNHPSVDLESEKAECRNMGGTFQNSCKATGVKDLKCLVPVGNGISVPSSLYGILDYDPTITCEIMGFETLGPGPGSNQPSSSSSKPSSSSSTPTGGILGACFLEEWVDDYFDFCMEIPNVPGVNLATEQADCEDEGGLWTSSCPAKGLNDLKCLMPIGGGISLPTYWYDVLYFSSDLTCEDIDDDYTTLD